MRTLLTALLALGQSLLVAQDASLVPGLRVELARAQDDTARADLLARLCFNLIAADPDSARIWGEQALELAGRIGHPKALADAHNNLGWLDTQQGRIAEASAHLDSALAGFRRIGNPAHTSIALSNLGWLADKQGDRVTALARFDEALALAAQAADSASMAVLLYSIGSTYNRMQDFPRARGHLERSLAIEERLGRRDKQGNCLVAIANAWRSEGHTGKALANYAEAGERYAATGDQYGAGMVQENTGDLYADLDPARALRHYRLALAHYDTLHSAADMAYILHRIGLTEVALERPAEAGRHFQEALTLAAGTGSTELVMDLELALAELAVQQGRSDEALAHYRRHMALKDSLQGAEARNELMRLRARFETDQAEQENALLKAENALGRANEAKLKARWTAAAAVSIGLVLLLALLYRNYRQRGRHTREVERFNAELQAQRDQVQRMNDLLELKVLRSQLNPHFIHNCQNSAMAMVKEGRNGEALVYLQGLSRLMRMVLEHSVNDRITVEEEMAFLRLYVELEGLRLPDLRFEMDADRRLLDEEAELPALLVQPFVENALWHGLAAKEGGRELSIRFSATEAGLCCTVRDNGCGRSAHGGRPEGHRSLGTELTNERLQLLTHRLQQRGRFRIHDLKDLAGNPAGTEVVIELDG